MRVIGVIPARYQSSRLEGKPLADILEKPMIQHVYQRARLARNLDDVMVATDDEDISRAVVEFDGKAVMMSAKHRFGAHRVAEVIASDRADVVFNIQGGEPMLDPLTLEEVGALFRQGTSAGLVTLKKGVFRHDDFADPGVVKVVTDPNGMALYFSRSLIPYPRNRTRHCRVSSTWVSMPTRASVYSNSPCCRSRRWKRSKASNNCGLSKNGIPILVVETKSGTQSISIDTQADLERVCEALRVEALTT